MHECPECGQACDCDGEDIWNDIGSSDWTNCTHECEDYEEDDLMPDMDELDKDGNMVWESEKRMTGREILPGVVAHVSDDVQPETIQALQEMFKLLEKQLVSDIGKAMVATAELAEKENKLCYLYNRDGGFQTSFEYCHDWIFKAYPGGRKEMRRYAEPK